MDYMDLQRTGLTHKELAAIIGVNHETVGKWFRGGFKRPLHVLTRRRLDDVLPVLLELVAYDVLPLRRTRNKARRAADVERISNYVEQYAGRLA